MKRLAKKAADRERSGGAARQSRKPSCFSTTWPAFLRRPSNALTDDDEKAKLALEIDLAMREQAPAGWKGDETREKQVLNALFPIMSRDRTATQAIFEIIKNQPGY